MEKIECRNETRMLSSLKGCEIDPRYCDAIVDRYVAYKKSKQETYTIKKNEGEIEHE